MTNNIQQTAVEWYIIKRDVLEIEVRLGKLSANEYEQELIKAEQQAKAMEATSKQMSYGDGYSNGYDRALELVKWKINNELAINNK